MEPTTNTKSQGLSYLILVSSFYIIGLTVAWFSWGQHHPDEHFQVLEYSRYILGLSFTECWEFSQQLRHPQLSFILAYFIKILGLLKINNPYLIINILRCLCFLINGSIQLFCIHKISLALFEEKKDRLLMLALWISFPMIYYFFARTSTENFGTSFLLVSTVLLLELTSLPTYLSHFFSGFFFMQAFSMRFPTGVLIFIVLGYYWKTRQATTLRPLIYFLFGLTMGALIFMAFEYNFYHQLIASPVAYLNYNVLSGLAGLTFGKEVGLSLLVFLCLFGFPYNFIVAYQYLTRSKSFAPANSRKQLILTTFAIIIYFFLIVHLKIAHKEFRFMLPIYPFLFVLIAYGFIKFELRKQVRMLSLFYFIPLIIFGYFYLERGMSKNVLLSACPHASGISRPSQASIWSEGIYGFYDFPAFFCDAPHEAINFLQMVPIELINSKLELQEYLSNFLAFIPPANIIGKARYIFSDGWFYQDVERKTDLENKPIFFAFKHDYALLNVPTSCQLNVMDPKNALDWLAYLAGKYHLFKPTLNYYLHCI